MRDRGPAGLGNSSGDDSIQELTGLRSLDVELGERTQIDQTHVIADQLVFLNHGRVVVGVPETGKVFRWVPVGYVPTWLFPNRCGNS